MNSGVPVVTSTYAPLTIIEPAVERVPPIATYLSFIVIFPFESTTTLPILAVEDVPEVSSAFPVPVTYMFPLFTTFPLPSIPVPLTTLIVPSFTSSEPTLKSIPTPSVTFITELLIIVPPAYAAIPTVEASQTANVPPKLIVPLFIAIAPSLTRTPIPPLSIFIIPLFVNSVPAPVPNTPNEWSWFTVIVVPAVFTALLPEAR